MSLNSFRSGLGNLSTNPAGKFVLLGVGGLLVFSLVYSGLGNNLGSHAGAGAGNAAARSGDDVIATVNGDGITRRDYDTARSGFVSQIQQMGRPIAVSETPLLNNTVLDQLINTKLQLQQAKLMKITVTDAELQKEREMLVDKLGLRQRLSLPATATMDDVNSALTKNGGQPLSDDAIRQLILIGDPQMGVPGKLANAQAAAEPVTAETARQFYTQYHTRHILVDNKSKSDVQAKALAEQILAKAKAPGADFAALAKQYSDDPGTKAKGGDDGFIDESTGYVPEFKNAAFSLKPKQVAPDLVVSPRFGYFIIKLDEIKSSVPPDFDKNIPRYVSQVQQQRAQAKSEAMLTSLKDSAKIEVSDPALAGDRALTAAMRGGNPALSQPKFKEAQASYLKALQGTDSAQEKGTINAALAQADISLHQLPEAIKAYEAAVTARDDASLRMTLGQLYMQSKDKDNAVKQFEQASQLAWNDQGTHLSLLTNFRQLGRNDLATKEVKWLQSYSLQHPAPSGGPGGPNSSITLPPGAGPARPAGSIHVGPPAPASKPGQ